MIIGFAGKAASGKTTAARHLASLARGETRIIPMAQALRDEVESFLRRAGASEHVPLVYGDQDDKVRVFYIDTVRAGAACDRWPHFVQTHGDIQDRTGMTAVTVRRLLQWWGTEYRRAQDPDYWTKAWERQLAGYDLDRVHVLVDDVRFMNEIEVIGRHGGRFVRIIRPGVAAAGNHASEISLDGFADWDEEILNDGTLDDFLVQVARLQQRYRL
ncbi:deoxynucleotide monophosphate kinase family protein [Geothermobacter ehrlichii]|nr:hypothetical protein [Geothermobacter ehrlichii]